MLARHTGALALVLLAAVPAAAVQTGEQLEGLPDEPTTRVATRGANFLELGVGARAMSLGGAYTALAHGVSAMYWNAAGLAEVRNFAAGYSYSPLYADLDMNLHYVGVAVPLFGGVVGASANVFTSGDIERTTLAFPDGSDPLFGATFEWTAQAYGLHYAFSVTDRLAFGLGGQVISEGITDSKATYYGLNVGTRFRTGLLGTVIGASLSNLGTNARHEGRAIERRELNDPVQEGVQDFQLVTQENALPTVFRFSVLWDVTGTPESLFPGGSMHRISVLTDISDAIDTDAQTLIGVEYSLNQMFFVRGGKKWFNEDRAPWDFADGLSGGLGVRVPVMGREVGFDYAYVGMGDLSNLQVFTFEFGF